MQLPDELDADLLDILGRPNFWCGPLARVMRTAGADIPHKAEAEQAHVLHKLLGFYAEHGADWRKHAGEWLETVGEKAKAATAAAA